ncbi:MAG: hypothetical protein R3215_02185 [Halomonas sp.]|nr:hypothetical protein [Halomonas sp.]
MTVTQMLKSMTSAELAEQMAFDSLKDEKYREKLEAEADAERWARMTPEEQGAEQRRRLMGK